MMIISIKFNKKMTEENILFKKCCRNCWYLEIQDNYCNIKDEEITDITDTCCPDFADIYEQIEFGSNLD